MTPAIMRDRFLKGTAQLPEFSVITTGQFFKEHNLLQDLKVYEDELFEIYTQIWTDLEVDLIKVRGK